MTKSFVCKKDLYKSTYKANAFVNGKVYSQIKCDPAYPWVRDSDKDFIWILDEMQNAFSFSISDEQSKNYLNFADYFDDADKVVVKKPSPIFVGAPVTMRIYSDGLYQNNNKFPATIVKVNRKSIHIRLDTISVDDGKILFKPNNNGTLYKFYLNKNNKWSDSSSQSLEPAYELTFGKREAYIDL